MKDIWFKAGILCLGVVALFLWWKQIQESKETRLSNQFECHLAGNYLPIIIDKRTGAFFAIGADKSAPGKWIYRESPLAHFQWLASKYGYLGPWDADQFKPLQDKN